ncbi:hypothetical protein DUNSADRAFT_14207 [Dunaliella salina]|uniref:NTF2 domain-containing protein n=1 Tax=Dunaliella salina TaxID=3046 RepID=A0ABZ3KNC2_DUNSA|nr:hypothetical protein DUNSADRAFT_14207 [Dunaliella salina]|eukprot:KAF5830670.1 hypothetical protein DUNSADRAFT_14207 [Dunaliella salina]
MFHVLSYCTCYLDMYMGLQALAPLYSDASILEYDGAKCKGRQAIMAQLASASASLAARMIQKHEVKSVDCQPLGLDGSALVHVQGLQVSEAAGDAEAAVAFTEAFILCQVQPGEYYVANQVHRTLP